MSRIYKVSFHIYRIILISIIPIYFFCKFIVGMAGHNSEIEITDYLLLAFAILTPTLLTVLSKTDKVEIALRNTLRFIIIGLVLISIGFLFYGLYDSWLLYQDQNFGIGDNIPVAIILLLITLSSILLVGLAKNKI
jgi:hypothetical protein